MRIVRTLAVAAALLGGPAGLAAQSSEGAKQPPCAAEEHRQFDFWLGEWNVTQPDGKPAGQNTIQKILGGCVLYESWTAAGGSHAGHSFNIYDAGTRRWHQTWVDNAGLLLQIDGTLAEGSMVLRGETPGRDGEPVRHEIRWTPLEDGSVKQHWRTSRDGQDWSDAFVGIYKKVE